PEFPFPPGDIPDVRDRGTLFEDVVALQTGRQSLSTDASQPELVRTVFATPNIVRVLGLHVEHGRDFEDRDATPLPAPPAAGVASGPSAARPAGAPPSGPPAPAPPAVALPPPNFTVILSHEFWQRHYGGDVSIVGRSIDLGNATATIVGVLAP